MRLECGYNQTCCGLSLYRHLLRRRAACRLQEACIYLPEIEASHFAGLDGHAYKYRFFYKKKRDLYPVHLGVISPPPSCVPVQMTCCYCNRCEPEIKCEVKEFDFQRKVGRFLSRITTFTSILIFLLLAQCPLVVLRLHVSWHVCPADTRLCLRALIQSKVHVHAGEGRVFPLADSPTVESIKSPSSKGLLLISILDFLI